MNGVHILTVEFFRYAGLACVLLLAVAAVALCLLCADAANARKKPSRTKRARTKPPRTSPAVCGELPIDFPVPAHRFAFRELSTPQLCETLRRSYLPLPDRPPEQGESERVRLRGQLLDEIERRDPEGFHRWLATLPQAGSDPSRYLSAGNPTPGV